MVEPLDAYSDHIRSLHAERGQKAWFILLQADTRLREEIFERWLRREEQERDRSEMNPFREWDFLFRSAAEPEFPAAKANWEREVKDLAIAYIAYRKTFREIMASGSVLDNIQNQHMSRRTRQSQPATV
jgi:hypothetical protein